MIVSGKKIWTSSDQKEPWASGKKIEFCLLGNGELLKVAKYRGLVWSELVAGVMTDGIGRD